MMIRICKRRKEMFMATAQDRSSFFLDHLCAVGACGAFGIVIVLATFQGLLTLMVPNWFVPYVLGSGFTIFGLVLIQAFFLLAKFVHDHDYGNNHSPRLWRHAVLCLPTILYLFGLPSQAFTSRNASVINEQGHGIIQISIEDLQIYANDDVLREKTAGLMVRVKGQFAPNPKSKMAFRLVHFKMDRQGFELH